MNKKKQPGDSPEIKMHVWLEKDNGVYFGQGRYDLLMKIEELGSLKLAAEAMGISYRGAWGKIKKTEEIIGEKLIEKESNKEGYKLTEFGKKFMEEFNALHNDILEFAEKRSREMMTKIF
ncbi:MAG TPA: LysR family transcriptional regulator [Spirochaetota bacterium]|nr:LysR family transcriptional regulator [Spirochaetota bacterium]